MPPPNRANDETKSPHLGNRRSLISLIGASLLGCACAVCLERKRANAEVTLIAPSPSAMQKYDTPRNKIVDAAFARGMAYGMVDYERAVSKKKRQLFDQMFTELPQNGAVVAEVGMGSFPNALYFGSSKAPAKMDILGVDPNDSMEGYARDSAERAGLLKPERGNTLRVRHGVAEALPFESASVDCIICTLTLCSVPDPVQAMAEFRRVLKPGGQFLFLEHVLSETDPLFAEQQRRATPMQMARADGCRLDRRTLQTINSAGFRRVDGQYFELQGFNYLNPTAAGIAYA